MQQERGRRREKLNKITQSHDAAATKVPVAASRSDSEEECAE